jgi:hypothetical protein
VRWGGAALEPRIALCVQKAVTTGPRVVDIVVVVPSMFILHFNLTSSLA